MFHSILHKKFLEEYETFPSRILTFTVFPNIFPSFKSPNVHSSSQYFYFKDPYLPATFCFESELFKIRISRYYFQKVIKYASQRSYVQNKTQSNRHFTWSKIKVLICKLILRFSFLRSFKISFLSTISFSPPRQEWLWVQNQPPIQGVPRAFFPGLNDAGAWSWSLTSI